MVKVKVYGKLGKKLGRSDWEFEAKTPAEVFRAIEVNSNSVFSNYLMKSLDKGIPYVFCIDGHRIMSQEDMFLIEAPLGKNSEVKIFPSISGSGIEVIISIVVSVVLSVVSALLMPTPEIDLGSDNKRRDSYLFAGAPRPARQGLPIPVGYGEMIIYPTVISAEFNYGRTGGPAPVGNDDDVDENIRRVIDGAFNRARTNRSLRV